MHREIEGEIQNATITCNPAGQYFVCIGVKRDIQTKEKKEKAVGVDLGIKTLVVCSDGDTYPNIKPQKNFERLIKIRSKALSRTQRNKDGIESKGRLDARRYLAKVYNKASNIRNNHLHQISSRIINENQVVVLEDLNMNYPPAKDGWVSAPTNSPLIAGLTSGQAANSVVPTVLYFNPSCKIFKAAFWSRSTFSKQLKQNHSLSEGFNSLF